MKTSFVIEQAKPGRDPMSQVFSDFDVVSVEMEAIGEQDNIPELRMDDLLRLVNPVIIPQLKDRVRHYGSTHLCCYECQDMWSSHIGIRKVLVIGPKNTRQLAQMKHQIDCENASTRKQAVAYAAVPEDWHAVQQ
jgi:hypothetical protein